MDYVMKSALDKATAPQQRALGGTAGSRTLRTVGAARVRSPGTRVRAGGGAKWRRPFGRRSGG